MGYALVKFILGFVEVNMVCLDMLTADVQQEAEYLAAVVGLVAEPYSVEEGEEESGVIFW